MFNQREIIRAMQRLGMQMSNIEATEVIIIKKNGSKIIIKDPNVSKVKIQGQSIFQITGIETEINFSEEDIQIVMDQTKATREEAIKALEETNDLAEAILLLQNRNKENS